MHLWMQLQTVLNDNAFQKCLWSCAVIVTVPFFILCHLRAQRSLVFIFGFQSIVDHNFFLPLYTADGNIHIYIFSLS